MKAAEVEANKIHKMTDVDKAYGDRGMLPHPEKNFIEGAQWAYEQLKKD